MDREAVHDVAPWDLHARNCPEPVPTELCPGAGSAVIGGDRTRAAMLATGVHPRRRGRCMRQRARRRLRRAYGGDGPVSARTDCPVAWAHRFAPVSSTCAAGMDSPCNSIFLRLAMAVME